MNASVTRAAKKTTAKKAATTTKTPAVPASKASTAKAPAKPASKKTVAASPEVSLPAKAAAKTPRRREAPAPAPDVLVSSNKASAPAADRILKPEVSRAREVATKTSKATPALAEGEVLSEAQLLQMSDKDYMNQAQLAFFKARLQQLERDLLKNAGETTEHLRETVLVPDPADRATIEEEHALELRTRDRERKLLKKVQQSLASIESGDYGWCEETGEPIGIPRLLARPTATLSLEAQQRRELKQKLYGD
ncbi:MAG: dksA [Paucimonas sp.]|jgi:DnaK suppressor protein|nr:dksA [Paucimonas sp.]